MNAIPAITGSAFLAPVQSDEFVSDPSRWAPIDVTIDKEAQKELLFRNMYLSAFKKIAQKAKNNVISRQKKSQRLARQMDEDEDLAPCANNPNPPLFRCEKCNSTQLIDNKCKC